MKFDDALALLQAGPLGRPLCMRCRQPAKFSDLTLLSMCCGWELNFLDNVAAQVARERQAELIAGRPNVGGPVCAVGTGSPAEVAA